MLSMSLLAPYVKKQYVWKTEQTLRSRFNTHRYSILHKKDTPVARHFNSDNHFIDNITLTAIDLLPNADTFQILNKETFWIKTLNTVQPLGISAHDQSSFPIARL